MSLTNDKPSPSPWPSFLKGEGNYGKGVYMAIEGGFLCLFCCRLQAVGCRLLAITRYLLPVACGLTPFGRHSGPFFSLWILIAVSMSFETIMPGSIPCSAACSKKKDEGAMPDEEFGSVMRTRPFLRTKPSMRP